MPSLRTNRLHTFIIVILLMLLVANTLNNYAKPNASISFIQPSTPPSLNLTDNWQYRWGDSPIDATGHPIWIETAPNDPAWIPLTTLGYPPDEPRESYIWFRTILPEGEWQDPALFLPLTTETFEVYLGTTKIYQFGDVNTFALDSVYGWPWHIIPLPADYQQQQLTFRVYEPPPQIRVMREVIIGNSNTHLQQIIQDDLPTVIVIITLFMLSFFVFILYLRNPQEYIYSAFVILTVAIGTTLLTNTYIKQLIVDSPTFWYPIRIMASYGIVLGLALFLEQLWAGKRIWIFQRMWQIWLLIIVSTAIINIYQIEVPLAYVFPVSFFGAVTLIIFVVTVIILAIRGATEARIVGVGLVAMMGTIAFGVISIVFGGPAWVSSIVASIFLFIISLGAVLVSRFTAVYRQKETYAQQLEGQNKALQTYQTQLQHLVDERTAELSHTLTNLQETQAQLIRAKNAAEVANEAKSEFLSNMSHELRTPLNAVLGYAQILKRDQTLHAKQKDSLQTIEQSGQHLLTLINDILDIAKIEARKLDLVPKPSRLPALFDSIVSMVALQAKHKGLTFTYQCYGDFTSFVMVDEKRLRQVLLNLLGNAIKFTTQGTVSLTVTAPESIPQTTVTTTVKFAVTDTGIGMSPDNLSRIFDPFEQVGSNEERIKGTGLGLTISQQLVQAMGGEITVTSALNQGSRFTFALTLPLTAMSTHTPTTKATQNHISGYDGPRRTILVVDDTVQNRQVMVDLLHPLGFKVVEAKDGQEGINLAQKLHPDLIIMDLVMIHVTGIEAIQQLRRTPHFKTLPIIAASASVLQAQEASTVADCDDIITKPIIVDELLTKISTLLNLTWHYAADDTPDAASQEEDAQTTITYPSPEIIETLHGLAAIGDMPTLINQLQEIEKTAALRPFIQKLLPLAQDYDDEAIVAILEAVRTQAST